jgi:plasmid rolling circle replication initiator protein Rep
MVQNTDPKVKEQADIFDHLYYTPLPENTDVRLSTISENDGIWDRQRAFTSYVGAMYSYNDEFTAYAERMNDCSGYLKFGMTTQGMRLKEASFCRVRYCPVCQWRKAMYWKAMMQNRYDDIRSLYPKHRFLLLTLTLANPHITELRDTLKLMNNAWSKLTRRKVFNVVDGWIRTTEVTRDEKRPNTHAHPHFHCLLMVKPSYFTHSYIKQMDWVRLWADCLSVDYLPNVDIRAIKGSDIALVDDVAQAKDGDEQLLRKGVVETLKYAVKPDDFHGDESWEAYEWFYELTRQTHKLRFVATGGALKDVLKDGDLSDEQMITGNDTPEQATDERRLYFGYYREKNGYIYNPKYNE